MIFEYSGNYATNHLTNDPVFTQVLGTSYKRQSCFCILAKYFCFIRNKDFDFKEDRVNSVKIIKFVLLPVIFYAGIFIIYPATNSILFTVIWSLAIIFGIYNLDRLFPNRKNYLVATGIVFGIFLGSALFIIDHSISPISKKTVDTVNVFIPLVTYINSFKHFKEKAA